MLKKSFKRKMLKSPLNNKKCKNFVGKDFWLRFYFYKNFRRFYIKNFLGCQERSRKYLLKYYDPKQTRP